MAVRTLYLARHGVADAFGNLLDEGRVQCERLAHRLRDVPLDAIWHSPLPRAADSAAIIATVFPNALLDEAPELVDHVPHVPPIAELSSAWAGFFDGYSEQEAVAGAATAHALVRRFARPPGPGKRSTHELLVTHAYPIAWLVREALGAPPRAWLSLSGITNTGLTVIEYADGEPPAVVCVNDRSHLAAREHAEGGPPAVVCVNDPSNPAATAPTVEEPGCVKADDNDKGQTSTSEDPSSDVA